MEKCKGNSTAARKNFWSYVKQSKKQNSEISAVLDPDSGVVHCNLDSIRSYAEKHLISQFQGSYDKIVPDPVVSDHSYSSIRPPPAPSIHPDHSYSSQQFPNLPKINNNQQILFFGLCEALYFICNTLNKA